MNADINPSSLRSVVLMPVIGMAVRRRRALAAFREAESLWWWPLVPLLLRSTTITSLSFSCTVSVRVPARLLLNGRRSAFALKLAFCSSLWCFSRAAAVSLSGTWGSLVSLHRWWLEHASVRESRRCPTVMKVGSSAVASVVQRDRESSVIAEEPGRVGAPPNKANAEDDELRFAPFLASDPQGRWAAKGSRTSVRLGGLLILLVLGTLGITAPLRSSPYRKTMPWQSSRR